MKGLNLIISFRNNMNCTISNDQCIYHSLISIHKEYKKICEVIFMHKKEAPNSREEIRFRSLERIKKLKILRIVNPI